MGRLRHPVRTLGMATVCGCFALSVASGPAIAGTSARTSAGAPGTVPAEGSTDPYVQAVVDAITEDLRLPLASIPGPGTGVLGVRSAQRLQAQQAAAAADAARQEAERQATATTLSAANRAVAAASRNGPVTSTNGSDVEAFLACTRWIESRGNYAAVSPGGTYRGAYQFDQPTWDGNAAASGRHDLVGMDPARAAPADQDQMARDLYARRGNQPWGGRC